MSMAQFQDALGDYYDAGMIGDPPKREDFPDYRIEWTGRIKVYVPVKPESAPDEDQMAWAAYHHARHEADQ